MPDPQRGEVWLADLGLAAKVRPCLILSVPRVLAVHGLKFRSKRGSCGRVSLMPKTS